MKKIGFIDLFIDEWHANNYPAWIRDSKVNKNFEVAMAWESANNGKRSLEQWCSDFKVTPARSLEEVVEKCDVLCVLAPSNPEVHEELAAKALESGKPLYIDKPFTSSMASARRIFEKARKHGTPLMSSSALRYGNELIAARDNEFKTVRPDFVATTGGGRSFQEYGIHQIEMIVSLFGTGATRVMQSVNPSRSSMWIDYPDDRRATVVYSPEFGFTISAASKEKSVQLFVQNNIFPNLIDEILRFFETGVSPIDPAQTIEIAGILEAGIKGLKTPCEWVKIG